MTGLVLEHFYILTMGMNWILKFVPVQSAARSQHIMRDLTICYVWCPVRQILSSPNITPIKGDAWHTFVLDLKLENKKYLAEWLGRWQDV